VTGRRQLERILQAIDDAVTTAPAEHDLARVTIDIQPSRVHVNLQWNIERGGRAVQNIHIGRD
jgi:hypothetical protein